MAGTERRIYNVQMNLAADSLQIAHLRLFDAIVDCAHTLSGGPRTGLGAGRPCSSQEQALDARFRECEGIPGPLDKR